MGILRAFWANVWPSGLKKRRKELWGLTEPGGEAEDGHEVAF